MKNISNVLFFSGLCFAIAWILWDIWLLIAHLNLSVLNAQGTYPVWLVVLGFLIPGLAWVMPLLTLLQVKKVNDTYYDDMIANELEWKKTRIGGILIIWWLLYYAIVINPILRVYVFPPDLSTPQGVNNLLFFCLLNFVISIVWGFWAMSVTKNITEEQEGQHNLIGGPTPPPVPAA